MSQAWRGAHSFPGDDMPVTVTLNATQAGWVAEITDGERDVAFVVVQDAGGNPQLREVGKLESGDTVATEIRCLTKGIPKRNRVTEVHCFAENWTEPGILLSSDKWDAVFWTESAVKKFLYPYYHSQRLWNQELAALEQQFDADPDAIALAHLAPSRTAPLRPGVNDIGVVVPRPGSLDPSPIVTGADYLRQRQDPKER